MIDIVLSTRYAPNGLSRNKASARSSGMRIAGMLDRDIDGIHIGIVSDNMPSETFQIFEDQEETYVATSPFRLGEMPNIRTGIATITTAPDAVTMYRKMIDRLWTDAAKGKEGADLLKSLLDRA